jgi:hypothetical protein
MRKNGIEISREAYIDINWDEMPDPWTVEDEMRIPDELQDWTQVKQTDDAPIPEVTDTEE